MMYENIHNSSFILSRGDQPTPRLRQAGAERHLELPLLRLALPCFAIA